MPSADEIADEKAFLPSRDPSILPAPSKPASARVLGLRSGFGWGLLVALALGIAALLLIAGGLSRAPETPESRSEAPDFSAPRLGGGELRLSDLRGRPVVLNFWASWCPPCRAEARDFEAVWQAYRDRGVVFVGVNIQDTEEGALGFLQDFGVSYPSVQDTSNEIAVAYRVNGIPVTYFIDREGRVAGRSAGALTEKQLVARVEEILP